MIKINLFWAINIVLVLALILSITYYFFKQWLNNFKLKRKQKKTFTHIEKINNDDEYINIEKK